MRINKLHIKLDFIPSSIVFIVGSENHNAYIDRYNTGKDWHMNNDGLTTDLFNEDKGHIVLISVTDKPYDCYQIKGLIVHEITHAVEFIMDRHGLLCSEVKAYLSQYLYIKIMKYYDNSLAVLQRSNTDAV